MRTRIRSNTSKVLSDVNITPLVDTCLVLLILFIITTPFLVKHTVPIALPKSESGRKAPAHDKLFVTVSFNHASGKAMFYFSNDTKPVTLVEIKDIMSKNLDPKIAQTVFIYSDGKTPMEDIITLIDIISSKGGKVSLVTEHGDPLKSNAR